MIAKIEENKHNKHYNSSKLLDNCIFAMQMNGSRCNFNQVGKADIINLWILIYYLYLKCRYASLSPLSVLKCCTLCQPMEGTNSRLEGLSTNRVSLRNSFDIQMVSPQVLLDSVQTVKSRLFWLAKFKPSLTSFLVVSTFGRRNCTLLSLTSRSR